MNIIVEGIRYTHFLNARVHAKMGALTREWELTAATRGIADIPFYAGQAIEIWDEGDRLVNGYIERITTRSSGKGHVYTMAGRDLLADVVDSNLPRVNNLRAPLPAICSFILKFLGIKAKVIDEAGTGSRPFTTVIAPDPEDTAGEFLATLARRKRALLQSDGDANMVISNGVGTSVEASLINRADGVDNNLLSATLTIDHSQRFGRYSTEAQINMASANQAGLNTPVRQIVAQRFFISDPQIRQSRFRTTAHDYNLGMDEGLDRPKWEIGLNRAESIRYEVEVPGFRDWEGRLWQLNTAPTVIDEFNGILDVRMLISEVEYSFDEEGKTTRMTLTDRDAFKAELKIRKDIELDGPPTS